MKYDYDEQDDKRPTIAYILTFAVTMTLIFLVYTNIKLTNQVDILGQQLSSLTQNSSGTNYATKDDVSAIREQIGNLQDSSYKTGIKVNSIEQTLDDITSFIGLDAEKQNERDAILNQIRQN